MASEFVLFNESTKQFAVAEPAVKLLRCEALVEQLKPSLRAEDEAVHFTPSSADLCLVQYVCLLCVVERDRVRVSYSTSC